MTYRRVEKPFNYVTEPPGSSTQHNVTRFAFTLELRKSCTHFIFQMLKTFEK